MTHSFQSTTQATSGIYNSPPRPPTTSVWVGCSFAGMNSFSFGMTRRGLRTRAFLAFGAAGLPLPFCKAFSAVSISEDPLSWFGVVVAVVIVVSPWVSLCLASFDFFAGIVFFVEACFAEALSKVAAAAPLTTDALIFWEAAAFDGETWDGMSFSSRLSSLSCLRREFDRA